MAAPTLILSPLADAVPLAQVRRALVIKLRHHGDVLLAAPVLSALKEAAPHCEVDALVFTDTAAMLSEHPALSQLHCLPRKVKGTRAKLRAEYALFAALRARQFDLIIHLTDHPRGAWLARFLGARWRVGPRREKGGKLWQRAFTHIYRTVGGGRRHTVETHLDALRRIGIQPHNKALQLVPGAAAEARVDALLGEHGLAAKNFILLHPASRWFFKTWPLSANASLLRSLAALGHQLVLTGAPDERERGMVAQIIEQSGVPAINLAGQLSLKELAALTARAKLFIGVDSAPMHIAAAVGTPCVALFGPSGDKEWGPWGVAHEIITSAHPCRPCGLDGCGGGKVSECLTNLPPELVLAAVERLLAGKASR